LSFARQTAVSQPREFFSSVRLLHADSSSVQEGLLFVSMTPDNMLSGTAAYQLDYSGRSPAVSPTPSAPEDHMLSLREAIDDPQIWMQSRQAAIEERIERLRLRRGRLQSEVAERDRLREEGRTGTIPEEEAADYCPYHVDEGEATAMGVSAPTPPPFTITTESGQEESDEDDAMPNAAVMADRLRRESRWIPERDSDDDDGHRTRVYTPGRQRYVVINTGIHRAAPRRAPSRIEPKESETESDGLIAPNAQFFIARHKNKITIKFTPAMSVPLLISIWSLANVSLDRVDMSSSSCGARHTTATSTLRAFRCMGILALDSSRLYSLAKDSRFTNDPIPGMRFMMEHECTDSLYARNDL
jgi:hypothetical protein